MTKLKKYIHWKITEKLASLKIKIKSGRWELLAEGRPGIRFILTAWQFYSLQYLHLKHGYKYLTCKIDYNDDHEFCHGTYLQRRCCSAMSGRGKTSGSYLRLRLETAPFVQCLRAGGRYWAQAATAPCSPAPLWSAAAHHKTQFTGGGEEGWGLGGEQSE